MDPEFSGEVIRQLRCIRPCDRDTCLPPVPYDHLTPAQWVYNLIFMQRSFLVRKARLEAELSVEQYKDVLKMRRPGSVSRVPSRAEMKDIRDAKLLSGQWLPYNHLTEQYEWWLSEMGENEDIQRGVFNKDYMLGVTNIDGVNFDNYPEAGQDTILVYQNRHFVAKVKTSL